MWLSTAIAPDSANLMPAAAASFVFGATPVPRTTSSAGIFRPLWTTYSTSPSPPISLISSPVSISRPRWANRAWRNSETSGSSSRRRIRLRTLK